MTMPTPDNQPLNNAGENGQAAPNAETQAAPLGAHPQTGTTSGAEGKPKSKVGKWLTGGLTAVVLIGLGFLGGTVVTQNSTNSIDAIQQGPGGGNGQGAPGGSSTGSGDASGAGSMPGGMTSGTITAVGDGTITIETQSGETVTISTGSNTSVTTTQQGSVSDLAVGDSIRVQGEESDGSISAQSITEGDAGGMPMGGGASGGPGSSQSSSSTN